MGIRSGSCLCSRMICLNCLPVYSSRVCLVVSRREDILHEFTGRKMGIDLKRLLHMYDYEINAEMSLNTVRVDWFFCSYCSYLVRSSSGHCRPLRQELPYLPPHHDTPLRPLHSRKSSPIQTTLRKSHYKFIESRWINSRAQCRADPRSSRGGTSWNALRTSRITTTIKPRCR